MIACPRGCCPPVACACADKLKRVIFSIMRRRSGTTCGLIMASGNAVAYGEQRYPIRYLIPPAYCGKTSATARQLNLP